LILPIMALLLLLWVMELLVLAKLLVFLFGSVFIGSLNKGLNKNIYYRCTIKV
jgi:hypothetical protein